MNEMAADERDTGATVRNQAEAHEAQRQPEWETPKMEDVSEQVTAQPYIRFT